MLGAYNQTPVPGFSLRAHAEDRAHHRRLRRGAWPTSGVQWGAFLSAGLQSFMRGAWLAAVLGIAGLLLGACSDQGPAHGPDVGVLTDAGSDAHTDALGLDATAPDTGQPDDALAPDAAPLGDTGAPDGSSDAGGLARPYEPCEAPQDCASGYCVVAWEGKVCAAPCSDGCKDGWLCTQDLASFPDVVFVCVPAHPVLCMPCNSDADCQGAGTGVAACVSYGEDGSFCGGDCAEAPCPDGFSCQEVSGADGARSQCVLGEGECPCSPLATAQGASTSCSETTAAGTCTGERHCAASGLTPCSALEPAAETCNGIDDDCDGEADEGLAGDPCTNETDAGACTGATVCGTDGAVVCDAQMPAAEACNGIDDDCDGETDEPGAVGCQPLYADADGDSFGVGEATCPCAAEGVTGATGAGDCDDADAAVHPGATEVCNGHDDDCDGLTDEEGASGCVQYHLDADGDGFGSDDDEACLCGPAGSYTVGDGGDCDDGHAGVHPGAVEVCNLLDDDCDGETDPAGAPGCAVYFADADGDGWGVEQDAACLCAAAAPHTATNPGDCDDESAGVNPAVPEACNGVDDDCDGQVDEGAAAGCTFYYEDQDRDGWGKPGTAICACAPVPPATAEQLGDCDDANPAVHPDASEACNGLDDDCDGLTDEPGAEGCLTLYPDADGDGYGQSAAAACLCAPAGIYTSDVGGDCNDGTAAVSPLAHEVCNGIDDDCDGELDEADSTGCTLFYVDRDKDGWGNPLDSQCLCSPTFPWVTKKTPDCKDYDSQVNPGYIETCNGIDDDCDGLVDEPGATGCSPYYVDADGDGYGVQGTATCLCSGLGTQTALVDGDCADGDPERSPAATDTCNAVDDDCDGGVDEGCGLAETGWPTYKYDARRTGHRPDAPGPLDASAGWTFPLAPGSALNNSVAIVPDGVIAMGGKNLVKLSFTGEVVWSDALPVSTFSRNSPTVREGGTILVPTGGALRLYAPDGALLWTATFTGETITAAPIVAEDGAIYVLSTTGLRKVDAAGEVVWTSPAPNTQTSPGHPAVAPNGRIHFATSNNSVYSVAPETGLAAWIYTQPAGYDTDSSVAIAPNGDVYQGFGSTVARLAPDGALIGTVGVGSDMDGDVALLEEDGAVFVYASPNSSTGLRRYTADLVHQWTYPLTKDGSANGVPVFDSRGDAYVGDDTGKFVCVKKDGTLRWSLAFGAPVVKSAAAVGPGFVVFGDGAGTLHFVGGAP